MADEPRDRVTLRLAGTPRRESATSLRAGNAQGPRSGGAPKASLRPAFGAGAGPHTAGDAAARAIEVARANREASALDALDARWVLACRVSVQLEGGRAAILSSERRERLLVEAQRLGLRRFDANLIIAIVQDSARCGEPPLGITTADRLPLVREARPAEDHTLSVPARILIAAAAGGALAASLVHWVLS